MIKRIWFTVLAFSGLICVLVWFSVISHIENNIKIVACDVGQGDAFLVTLKDFQILIDGGSNNKVINCLADNMPFWDRSIEVVVLSHPQKDHFGGLIDVFEMYEVKYLITTPVDSGSMEWGVLKELVGSSQTEVINPVGGDEYRFGLIYLDILHPTEEYLLANLEDYSTGNSKDVLGAYTSKKDPNEFSLVLILSYKEFDALFTGDIGPVISNMVAEEITKKGKRNIEYIKVPHHGSKNGLTENLLEAISPKVAVISAGINNSYGHPHKEIIELLSDWSIRTLRTDKLGNIEVVTNGSAWWVK
jgi:competence protein ComEC